MLRKLSTVATLAGVLTVGAVYAAHAAPRGPVVARASISAMASDSVTGCLQKGSSKDSYTVTDASGNKHMVTSAAVPLAGHVGHTVTLLGTTSAADNKMTGDTGMKMSGSNKMDMMAPMTVTAMHMVSGSCK